jgi:uncharacterized protein (TIGR00255 family)
MKKQPISIISMTGFAEHEFSVSSFTFKAQAKSVNHKLIETKLRAPRFDSLKLDIEVRALSSKILKRGFIEIHLTQSDLKKSTKKTVAAESYLEQILALEKSLPKKNKKWVHELIRLPGVLQQQQSSQLEDAHIPQILTKGIEPLLKKLNEERKKEGKKIKEHFSALLDSMYKSLDKIESITPQELETTRQSYEERIKRFAQQLGETQFSSDLKQRVKEEIALLLEKKDFEEERVRLRYHLDSFNSLLNSSKEDEIGKKIEFLMQEALREVNTLGTKCQNVNIREETLILKSLIDKVREQSSNVL